MNAMWSEIYRPTTVKQLVGNEDSRLEIIRWLSTWVSGCKPLLLIGPPGTGKTSLVHALAHEFDFDLIEMNASDTRSRIGLEARIIPMLQNKSLSGKKMLLFLDEIDGISSREDTGGIDFLLDIMQESNVPIIMAANSKNMRIKGLFKICRVIEFDSVSPVLMMILLDYVLMREKKDLTKQEKISVVKNSLGDVRALLNNAQSKVGGYESTREPSHKIDIADSINGFFSSNSFIQAKKFLSLGDINYLDPRYGMSNEERRKDMINALFSSIVSTPLHPDNLADLLDILSKIDLIVGRIGKKRYWRLLKYIEDILSHNLFEKSYNKGIKYHQYSMIWPALGPILARGLSLKKLLLELAHITHTSRSIFGSMYMPYIIRFMIDKKIDPEEIITFSNLDENATQVIAKEMIRMRKLYE